MRITIRTIPTGVANTFVIKDQGAVLVDCGPPKKSIAFINYLQAADLKPKDIRLIITTLGQWDHIGSAADFKELAGAEIDKEGKCGTIVFP